MDCFQFFKIPWGQGKSPKVVVTEAYDQSSLREYLKITIQNMERLKTIPSGKYFNHPYFGNLKLDKTIKFLEIHTKHHLEIINDIIKSEM